MGATTSNSVASWEDLPPEIKLQIYEYLSDRSGLLRQIDTVSRDLLKLCQTHAYIAYESRELYEWITSKTIVSLDTKRDALKHGLPRENDVEMIALFLQSAKKDLYFDVAKHARIDILDQAKNSLVVNNDPYLLNYKLLMILLFGSNGVQNDKVHNWIENNQHLWFKCSRRDLTFVDQFLDLFREIEKQLFKTSYQMFVICQETSIRTLNRFPRLSAVFFTSRLLFEPYFTPAQWHRLFPLCERFHFALLDYHYNVSFLTIFKRMNVNLFHCQKWFEQNWVNVDDSGKTNTLSSFTNLFQSMKDTIFANQNDFEEFCQDFRQNVALPFFISNCFKLRDVQGLVFVLKQFSDSVCTVPLVQDSRFGKRPVNKEFLDLWFQSLQNIPSFKSKYEKSLFIDAIQCIPNIFAKMMQEQGYWDTSLWNSVLLGFNKYSATFLVDNQPLSLIYPNVHALAQNTELAVFQTVADLDRKELMCSVKRIIWGSFFEMLIVYHNTIFEKFGTFFRKSFANQFSNSEFIRDEYDFHVMKYLLFNSESPFVISPKTEIEFEFHRPNAHWLRLYIHFHQQSKTFKSKEKLDSLWTEFYYSMTLEHMEMMLKEGINPTISQLQTILSQPACARTDEFRFLMQHYSHILAQCNKKIIYAALFFLGAHENFDTLFNNGSSFLNALRLLTSKTLSVQNFIQSS